MKKVMILIIVLFCCSIAYGKTLTITIPDEYFPVLVDSFTSEYRYQVAGTVKDYKSKEEFAKHMINEYIKGVYKIGKVSRSNQVAKDEAVTETDLFTIE